MSSDLVWPVLGNFDDVVSRATTLSQAHALRHAGSIPGAGACQLRWSWLCSGGHNCSHNGS
jgi:hypothetical protein